MRPLLIKIALNRWKKIYYQLSKASQKRLWREGVVRDAEHYARGINRGTFNILKRHGGKIKVVDSEAALLTGGAFTDFSGRSIYIHPDFSDLISIVAERDVKSKAGKKLLDALATRHEAYELIEHAGDKEMRRLSGNDMMKGIVRRKMVSGTQSHINWAVLGRENNLLATTPDRSGAVDMFRKSRKFSGEDERIKEILGKEKFSYGKDILTSKDIKKLRKYVPKDYDPAKIEEYVNTSSPSFQQFKRSMNELGKGSEVARNSDEFMDLMERKRKIFYL